MSFRVLGPFLIGFVSLVIVFFVSPVAAQHSHADSFAAKPAAEQIFVCIAAGLIVLRTVLEVVRTRPWTQDAETEPYERVRKTRVARQAVGLVVGAALGFGLFRVMDARLHALEGRELEDPRVAAARARVESMMPDEHDLEMLGALQLNPSDGAGAVDAVPEVDPHAGHDHAAEHDGHGAGGEGTNEGFHRLLFVTVGAALCALLTLAIPARPPAAGEPAQPTT